MKGVALLVLVVISVATASPQNLLGSKKCTWGPSYWCDHLQNAKECGAIKHCQGTAWAKQKIAETETCQFCKMMIGDVQEMVAANKTTEQIMDYMLKGCAAIKNAEGQKACDDAVRRFLPEILGMIADEMDPTVICTAMKVCMKQGKVLPGTKTASEDITLKFQPLIARVELQKTDSAAPFCSMCKDYVKSVQDMMQDKSTRSQIEGMLHNLCDMIKDDKISKMCKDDVDKWVPTLMDYLAKQMDPDQTCKEFGLCDAGLIKVGDPCNDCETVAQQVIKAVTSDKFEQDLETVMEVVCQTLQPFASECEDLVSKYLPQLLNLINQLTPDMVCQALGFCTDATDVSHIITNPAQLTLGLMEKQVSLIRGAIPMLKLQQAEPIVNKATAGVQCVLCEFVLRELDQLLEDDATEAEIAAALDKVCDIMPSSIRAECTAFIDTYGKEILNLLAQEMDPQQVCTLIGLCQQSNLQTNKLLEVNAGPEECQMCKMVITFVGTQLKEKPTQEEIEAVMEKMCKMLPARLEIQQKCDDFVKKWEPMIVEILLQEMSNPDQACQELNLCNDLKMPRFGTKACTYGPMYWCASRQNAKACKAKLHCERHVWNKGILTV